MDRKRTWFLLVSTGLLLAACATKQAGLPTPGQAGITNQPTAISQTVSYKMVPNGAEALCESAFSASLTSVPASAPLRTLVNQDFEKAGWVNDPNIMVIPHKEPLNARVEIKTLVCIRESRKQQTSYADGEPGYQVIWDVRLVQYPQGAVLAGGQFAGAQPPSADQWETIKQYEQPPWYGDRPEGSLIEWLFPLLEDPTIVTKGDTVFNLTISPDGKLIAASGSGNVIKIWNTSTGQMVKSLTLEADRVYVDALDFSPDGKLLAIPGGNTFPIEAVQLWDVTSGQLLHTVTTDESVSVMKLAFSPEGKILALGNWDGKVYLLDVASGQMVNTLSSHTDSITDLAFSPDGKLLASASLDGKVALWDAATGKLQQSLSAHTDGVNGVAFSPDGKTLASGGNDNTTKLWDVATGQNLRTLSGEDHITSVAFSPDGKTLASAEVLLVTLWDAAKGTSLHVLEGHTKSVTKVVFSPDGKSLFSGSIDTTIKRWDVATGQ